MRRSLAILGLLTARPDIRAAVAVASVIASGAATYWWCARSRRQQGMAQLLARLQVAEGREKALTALRHFVSGMRTNVLRGSLGPPAAVASAGVIVCSPQGRPTLSSEQWYYRLSSSAPVQGYGVLLISFDRRGRVS